MVTKEAAAWRSVGALSAIALLVHGVTLFSLGLVMPAMAKDFGGHAGWAGTALLIALSLASLPVGWALTQFDARRVIAAGMLLTAAGWAAAAASHYRLALLCAMAVAGAGIAAATIVPGIAIITRDTAARRGTALALFLGATIVAGAALPPVSAWAIGLWGWRGAMARGAGAMLALGLPLALMVTRGPAGVLDSGVRPPRATLTQRDFLLVAGAMTLLQLAINGILFATIDALTHQGLGRAHAVAAYSLANLAGLPALLLAGLVTDRVGARRAMVAISLTLAAGSAALASAGPMEPAGLAAFVLLWGVASALPGQAGAMLLADVTGQAAFPRMLGIVTALIGLVGATAPVLTDALRGADGSYTTAILVYAGLAGAAAPFIAMVRRGRSD
ncbi:MULTISPECIES: MFS transporter [unclassified Sphingobium]|uniref:MFS transporter n=1 Tax=unclassified Sphingobium TaxID=2611147 RepID=UPI0035A6C2E6